MLARACLLFGVSYVGSSYHYIFQFKTFRLLRDSICFFLRVAPSNQNVILLDPELLDSGFMGGYVGVFGISIFFKMNICIRYYRESHLYLGLSDNRNIYLLDRAATPGSSLPSRSSKEAPPPVDTWLSFSSTPYLAATVAVSPPPMMTMVPD